MILRAKQTYVQQNAQCKLCIISNVYLNLFLNLLIIFFNFRGMKEFLNSELISGKSMEINKKLIFITFFLQSSYTIGFFFIERFSCLDSMKNIIQNFVLAQLVQISLQLSFSLYYLGKLQFEVDFQSQTEERLSQKKEQNQSFTNTSFERKPQQEDSFKYKRDIKTPKKMQLEEQVIEIDNLDIVE